MGQTHPNAYRTEAQSKREQAAQLLAEAKDLESKADTLQGEVPKEPSPTKDRDESGHDELPTEPYEQPSKPTEPTGTEDASSDSEDQEEDSQDTEDEPSGDGDVHDRHLFKRKKH
jgi:hypothetical protein